jgi:ribosomal protein S12 methylthiotransferase accessory factor
MSPVLIGKSPEVDLADRLNIEVQDNTRQDWPLVLSRYAAVATIPAESGICQGFGCGSTIAMARRRAIMECCERFAQFTCVPSAGLTTVAGAELGDLVVSPESFGLYCDFQYTAPGFPFARYADREPIEWIEVREVLTGKPRYVPVEFVYPHASRDQKLLLQENSSGTAAHASPAAARLAALCELIERDAAMMFWHRQPATAMLQLDETNSTSATGDIEAIRAMGYVVIGCRLMYDLGVPCVLIIALRGDRFAYGLGCHPSLTEALEHAIRELSLLLRWQWEQAWGPRVWSWPHEVRKPSDHFALYDAGPYHALLRQILENTLRPPSFAEEDAAEWTSTAGRALDFVIARLVARGYTIYEFDLTPPALAECGASVIRTLVPGLIPLYFGYDMMRFGCRRLWGRDGPGRFCNLLPHFLV